jgi:hypothetical protein
MGIFGVFLSQSEALQIVTIAWGKFGSKNAKIPMTVDMLLVNCNDVLTWYLQICDPSPSKKFSIFRLTWFFESRLLFLFLQEEVPELLPSWVLDSS